MGDINISYFTALPGLLKPVMFVSYVHGGILQFILLICLASVADGCTSGGAWFFWLVLVISIIVLITCSVMILLGFWDRLPFNRPFVEFVYSAAFTGSFALCALIGIFASINSPSSANGHACNGGSAYGAYTFFCIMLAGVFGLNTFGHFTMWKNSDTTTMPPAGGPTPQGGV